MKTTVYIPAHNYAKYIEKAIESIISQTADDWELIIINDGSTDDTAEIIKKYAEHPKIRIIEQEKKGLNVSNNIALRLSNAKYFMRLDADDYLDENALAVLSNILDTKPEIGLVYSDYYLVHENDEVLEIVRRKKIGEEVELLDLPAHGACTMFRKESLLELGGYAEEFDCQDGYDIWVKFIQSFKPYNVNLPLFYYRQHSASLTKDQNRILNARMAIKRKFVNNNKERIIPRVLALIPAIKRPKFAPDEAFRDLAGRPLIWYTINEVLKSAMIDKVAVTSDDDNILDYCKDFQGIIPLKRPEQLTRSYSKISATALHALGILKKEHSYTPDAVMVLNINAPLRKFSHIEKSIDTMIIFGVDSVISVSEEVDYLYRHEKFGLAPINKQKGISLERKAVYKSNGALTLTSVSAINEEDILGKTIGHIIMLPEESIRIRNNFELWLVEKILCDWVKKERKTKNAGVLQSNKK